MLSCHLPEAKPVQPPSARLEQPLHFQGRGCQTKRMRSTGGSEGHHLIMDQAIVQKGKHLALQPQQLWSATVPKSHSLIFRLRFRLGKQPHQRPPMLLLYNSHCSHKDCHFQNFWLQRFHHNAHGLTHWAITHSRGILCHKGFFQVCWIIHGTNFVPPKQNHTILRATYKPTTATTRMQ